MTCEGSKTSSRDCGRDTDSIPRWLGVLVDASVLFSRTLRDWLFLLKIHSDTDMFTFTVHATEGIIAEVLYRLRRKYPDAPGHLTSEVHDRIVANLDSRVADFDFEIDGSHPGNDPDDLGLRPCRRAFDDHSPWPSDHLNDGVGLRRALEGVLVLGPRVRGDAPDV